MSDFSILQIANADLKSDICNQVLRSLRLWFGIESAIVDYVKDVRAMKTWVVYDKTKAVGFASVHRHFPETAEIHVMGIFREYHGQGAGHQLIRSIEEDLCREGVQFLTVKTLSESRPNPEYDLTRKFYLKVGFIPLEEFKTLWGIANPCLMLVKSIARSAT